MRFGSVCSGIGAPETAWKPLGWQCEFVSEIEKFPREVLKHRFGAGSANGPQLFGDFTEIQETDIDRPIDLLVGGTPCQSFSIAGLRGGLGDDRGNLALEFLRLADRLRPRWLVWENVPGVLSSNGGRDFGSILGGMGEIGYGVAYRILDAQYIRVESHAYAVPQRRRRVFVIGYLGDWRRAAAVLFERESLQRHFAPRRQAGQGTAADVAPSLVSSGRGVERAGETRGQDPVVAYPLTQNPYGDHESRESLLVPEVANPLTARMHKGINTTMDEGQTMVAHALRGEGFDASEDGTGRGTPIVPIAFSSKDYGADASENVSPTLRAGGHAGSHANAGVKPAVAFDMRGRDGGAMPEGPHDTANIRAASGGSSRSYVAETWAVRRLTPTECARLQGFPDDHCRIPWRGKPAEECPDGPQYKAYGNSMAVNVMSWIGQRIEIVDAIPSTYSPAESRPHTALREAGKTPTRDQGTPENRNNAASDSAAELNS